MLYAASECIFTYRSGELNQTQFFEITKYLAEETEHIPWWSATRAFKFLDRILGTTADYGLLLVSTTRYNAYLVWHWNDLENDTCTCYLVKMQINTYTICFTLVMFQPISFILIGDASLASGQSPVYDPQWPPQNTTMCIVYIGLLYVTSSLIGWDYPHEVKDNI